MHHLSIREKSGRNWEGIPVQIGIPLAKGMFFPADTIKLLTSDKRELPCYINPTVLWPDNSIKWCLLKGVFSLSAYENLDLKLVKNCIPNNTGDIQPHLEENEKQIQIKTKNYHFVLSKQIFNLFEQIYYQNQELLEDGFCNLRINPDTNALAHINSVFSKSYVALNKTQSIQIHIQGEFKKEDGESLAIFESNLEFFVEIDTVKCSFTIHNPKPSKHNSGLWDLGDPNSLFFESLELGNVFLLTNKAKLKTNHDTSWNKFKNGQVMIYQESSGGRYWNSPNHVNHKNSVPLTLKGYRFTGTDGVIKTGKRASPYFSIKSNQTVLNFHPEKFWQNFPKSIRYSDNRLTYGIFPQEFANGYELQPGEKKTHNFWINFNTDNESLDFVDQQPDIFINPDWISTCQVLPFPQPNRQDPIQKIISKGLVGESNFHHKRELIDEYGWRNFGDLYADHETDNYTGKNIFISHYNNQYDPLYGFLRLFTLSGNSYWFELADNLARHITDIDIYDTSYDKAEYNFGLFWHTDHYLPAETSSHRSYSKHQKRNAYEGHAGGGGPGGQHCYSTGLLYHFLLTGSEPSKKALLQLNKWIYHVYEGSGSIFDIIISIKNRNRVDLKNILKNQYPLDRGTGNYIVSALDKFYLTQEKSLLKHINYIIRNTINPVDDISRRNLLDVEKNWYYTVLLQAVNRYLLVKEEHNEFDDDFHYALNSFLHYVDWMLQNEIPYLDNPENLEFPNFTWAAQDIRKANIFFGAAYFDFNNSKKYLKKAKFFKSYVINTLNKTTTSSYTRILSILMQNQTPLHFYQPKNKAFKLDRPNKYQINKSCTNYHYFINLFFALLKSLANFSFTKELNWIKSRIGR